MIEFDKIATSGAHAATLNFDKAVVLEAGSKEKLDPAVKKLVIDMHWENEADGDLMAVFLDKEGNMHPLPGGIACYANLNQLPAGVTHSGDAREDGGDDDPSTPEETIVLTFDELAEDVARVLLIGTTHSEESRRPFSELECCNVFISDADTKEVLFGLELDEDHEDCTGVLMAEVYKRGADWRIKKLDEEICQDQRPIKDLRAKYNF